MADDEHRRILRLVADAAEPRTRANNFTSAALARADSTGTNPGVGSG
jgi:hypothetical protein